MATHTLTPQRLLTAVGNETVKGLRHGWNERLQILIEMPLFIIMVLLLGFSTGEGDTVAATGQLDWSMDTAHMSWLMVGVVTFMYTYLHVVKMFWRLLGEIQTGTLEQTYLSPLPSWIHVVAGRVAAAIAETAVVVALIYGVTSLFVPIELNWAPAALIPFALLLIGSAGFAMIIAGITLVWKRVALLNDLVLMLVFFFSAAVLPLDAMPGWAQGVAQPIFLTHVIESLRIAMIDGAPLPWGGFGGLGLAIGTTAAWFILGLALLKAAERTAQRRGSLARF